MWHTTRFRAVRQNYWKNMEKKYFEKRQPITKIPSKLGQFTNNLDNFVEKFGLEKLTNYTSFWDMSPF